MYSTQTNYVYMYVNIKIMYTWYYLQPACLPAHNLQDTLAIRSVYKHTYDMAYAVRVLIVGVYLMCNEKSGKYELTPFTFNYTLRRLIRFI